MARLLLLTLIFVVVGVGLGNLIVWIQYFSADEPFIEEFYAENEFVDPSVTLLDPILNVPEKTYEFGSIETSKSYSHNFEVKNDGGGPLVIRLTGTTCTCTSADMQPDESVSIPGGQKRVITLSWFATHYKQDFAQGATFETNDKNNPEFQLIVKGDVTRSVEPVPHEKVVSSVPADGTFSTNFDVVSFKHDAFDLTGHSFERKETADSFELTHLPLTADQLAEHKNAKSGFRCTLAIKEGIPVGPFDQEIKVSTDIDGYEPIQFKIKGTSVGNVAIINQSNFQMSDQRNEFAVGLVEKGKTVEVKFRLIIRGDTEKQADNKVTVVHSDPEDYLSAETGELEIQENLVVVPVTVKISGNGGPIVKMGPDSANMGKIQFKTPAEKTPLIDVYFSFSVAN